MDMIEFLIWFYSWFFGITIPAVIFVYVYNLMERR